MRVLLLAAAVIAFASANNEPKGSSPGYPNPAWSKGWCNKWKGLPDLNRPGYKAQYGRTFFHKPTSPADCAAKCDAHPDCTQAVYEEGGPWGQECWLGSEIADKTDRSSRGCKRAGGPCVDHCYHKTLAAAAKARNPIRRGATFKTGHKCYGGAGACEMERLPRLTKAELKAQFPNTNIDKLMARHASTGIPSADYPREQTGASHKVTDSSGYTVRVGDRPSRWNDALSDTIVSPGKFNKRHIFEPARTNTYSPHETAQCCAKQCRGKATGCRFGCKLWLSKSSLNWDGTKWWNKLRSKCQRDCEAKRSQTSKPQYGGSSVFEESFYKHFDQSKEKGCKQGCALFHTCMQKYE